jgi:hypothetical protein
VKRTFVEMPGYSAHRRRLEDAGELVDGDLQAMESEIMRNPEAGDRVQGTGGLRKIRFVQSAVGRGKRGGGRALYLDLPKRGKVYLIALFGKREQSDLSPAGRKLAAELVKQIKEEP